MSVRYELTPALRELIPPVPGDPIPCVTVATYVEHTSIGPGVVVVLGVAGEVAR